MKILEVSTGPRLETPLQVAKNVRAIPLGPIGAIGRVNLLAELLGPQKIEALKEHIDKLREQAALADPAVLIEIDVGDGSPEFSSGSWEGFARPLFERVRSALTLVFGEGFSPFAEVALTSDGVGLTPQLWT